MVARRKDLASSKTRRPPAKTPDAREQQLIGYAVELAEKQLLEGTASAQVITHYLKLAGGRERLEREKLEQENELLKARVSAIGSSQQNEELYRKALQAMGVYRGEEAVEDDEEY